MHINYRIQNTVTYHVLEHTFSFQCLLTSKPSVRKLIFCAEYVYFLNIYRPQVIVTFLFFVKKREKYLFLIQYFVVNYSVKYVLLKKRICFIIYLVPKLYSVSYCGVEMSLHATK